MDGVEVIYQGEGGGWSGHVSDLLEGEGWSIGVSDQLGWMGGG